MGLFEPDIDELYMPSKSTRNNQIVVAWQEPRCRQPTLGRRSNLCSVANTKIPIIFQPDEASCQLPSAKDTQCHLQSRRQQARCWEANLGHLRSGNVIMYYLVEMSKSVTPPVCPCSWSPTDGGFESSLCRERLPSRLDASRM